MAFSRAILNVTAISKASGIKTEKLDKFMKNHDGEKSNEKIGN
jgi:hypothetical protein